MEVPEVMGVPPNHPVVMDDHDLVLKPMVTTGVPPWHMDLDCLGCADEKLGFSPWEVHTSILFWGFWSKSIGKMMVKEPQHVYWLVSHHWPSRIHWECVWFFLWFLLMLHDGWLGNCRSSYPPAWSNMDGNEGMFPLNLHCSRNFPASLVCCLVEACWKRNLRLWLVQVGETNGGATGDWPILVSLQNNGMSHSFLTPWAMTLLWV